MSTASLRREIHFNLQSHDRGNISQMRPSSAPLKKDGPEYNNKRLILKRPSSALGSQSEFRPHGAVREHEAARVNPRPSDKICADILQMSNETVDQELVERLEQTLKTRHPTSDGCHSDEFTRAYWLEKMLIDSASETLSFSKKASTMIAPTTYLIT